MITHIGTITREVRSAQRYRCVGCGAQMTAVLGNIKAHHFRHSGDTCSWESYLHKLGKQVIKQRFDGSQTFNVKFYSHNSCPHLAQCGIRKHHSWKRCTPVELRTVNLKESYDTCQLEVTYRGFRADLMLTHSEHPERPPTFLEIAVTHRCDQNKISSGIRIIELDVQSELDLIQEITENIGEFVPQKTNTNPTKHISAIRFYNFKRTYQPSYALDRFLLYVDEGEYKFRIEHGAGSCHEVQFTHEEDSSFEVMVPAEFNQQRKLGGLGIALSIQEGFRIKNCHLCSRYNQCRIVYRSKVVDPSSGRDRIVEKKVLIKAIPEPEIDRWLQARNCAKFNSPVREAEQKVNSFQDFPYIKWRKRGR
ncbi:competence protein CoiA family protein [Parapedobacter composti]|uniref:hypothetical protein n=1 Tax=Parapedobacter composti TaxID=623281 RepID=UPI001113698D|nr:hypothetical protein [Parapedobacter composti]